MDKPPLGLKPEKFHLESRLSEIDEAMRRYLSSNYPIPSSWNKERNRILARLNTLNVK